MLKEVEERKQGKEILLNLGRGAAAETAASGAAAANSSKKPRCLGRCDWYFCQCDWKTNRAGELGGRREGE